MLSDRVELSRAEARVEEIKDDIGPLGSSSSQHRRTMENVL